MEYVAYVDGSYKQVNGVKIYSSAAIVKRSDEESWTTMSKASTDSLVSMHNVGGEIVAALMVFEHVLQKKDCTKLTLYYDYEGIANWLKKPGEIGYWNARNPHTKNYREYYYKRVKPLFPVEFVHVHGHSGCYGNDFVDNLAKNAIKEYIEKHYQR